jgi:hypothetical protein
MQAPLRKGKKEETLGRAKGVKRTGRSLLFGILVLGIVAVSSLAYTWERLVVESMLRRNLELEKQLDLISKHATRLSYEVAELEALNRIEPIAAATLGMSVLSWDDVIVIENVGNE